MKKWKSYGITQESCLSSPFLFAIFSNEFDRDSFLDSLDNRDIYKPVCVLSDEYIMDMETSE